MITLINHNTNEQHHFDVLTFPDGESFVKLDVGDLKIADILWKYESDRELFIIGLLFDILSNNDVRVKELFIPYLPHARQDRHTSINQPFSLKVFLHILGSFESIWDTKIYIIDVHSPVAVKEAILTGLHLINISSSNLIRYFDFSHINCLICPDKGAKDRVEEWAKLLYLPILYCEKTRDPNTGRLSNPNIVNPENLRTDWKYLLVDDIGTGFGTHIQLGNYIKTQLDVSIDICVSHAGFSNGVEPVLEVFDNIYTTNSLVKGYAKILEHAKDCIFVCPVEKVFGIERK